MELRAKIAQDGDHDEPTSEAQKPLPRKRFVVESRPLGLRRDLNFDKIEELLDRIDGPARR